MAVTHIHICIFHIFSIIVYHGILNIVPCAIQQDPIIHPPYISLHLIIQDAQLSPPSPHRSWPFLFLGEPRLLQLLRNPVDSYQRRDTNPRSFQLSILTGEAGRGSDWLMCISLSPRVLRASATAPFRMANSIRMRQRPGSWVTSSWGCTSQFMIWKSTGLAWLLQCKSRLLQESVRLTPNTHSLTRRALWPRDAGELCLVLCKALVSGKNEGVWDFLVQRNLTSLDNWLIPGIGKEMCM